MSIRFDRDQIQQLWQQKAQGKSEGTLAQALNDDKLSRQEYEAIKKEFQQSNPGEDFDKFLADALDGQLDTKANPNLLGMIGQLGRPGTAASTLSLSLNESRTGYADVGAVKFEQREWLEAALASDGDKNGRIDPNELSGLQGKIDDNLLQKLRAEGSVLTYDTDQRSLTFYPAPEAPSLHARYKDLKAELDIDLRDVDGITDRSRNDLSGTASGQLHFDWNGPLVSGIRQSVIDKTGGWVDMNARWVPAGDSDGYGPGYVIQAQSGYLATRPIVIKTDTQGQLFLESPGFGSWLRMKMGEGGLEKYALPQLKAMGLDMDIENKDGRLYLRPKTLELNNLPLSAQVAGGGQLNMQLGGHTRFTATPSGLKATFDRVPASGSSNVAGPVAVPDRNAQGAEAADTLKGKFRAGLNYDVKKNRLDTQVVVDKAEAQLNLDSGEVGSVPYLPADARKLAGDSVQGKLRLQGSYRTVNGSEHEGTLQGQVEITNRKGEESTDLYSRFKTKASQRDPNLAVSLSAVDVRHQRPGAEVRIRAEAGKADATGAKGPDLRLQSVQAQVRLSKDQLASVHKLLDEQHLASSQFKAALTAAGVTPNQLRILTEGSKDQIASLLSSSTLAKKIQTALVKVEAESAQISQGQQGVAVSAEKVTVAATAGNDAGTRVEVTGSVARASGEVGEKIEVRAEQTELTTEITRHDEAGRLNATTRLQASEIDVTSQGTNLDIGIKDGTGSGRAVAESPQGSRLAISGELDGLDASKRDGKLDATIASASGASSYRTAGGAEASIQGRGQNITFSQQGEGQWVLTAPKAEAKAQLEIQLDELKRMVTQLGKDEVARLGSEVAKAAPDQGRNLLERAGIKAEQLEQALAVFQNPELLRLLNTTDLMTALEQGRSLSIQVSGAGSVNASEAGTGLNVNSTGSLDATGQIKDDTGEHILSGRAQSERIETRLNAGELKVSTPELTARVDGTRRDGGNMGHADLTAKDLTVRSGAETGVDASRIDTKVSYQSSYGTTVEASAGVGQLHFSHKNHEDWVLSTPDISTHAQVQLEVDELRKLVQRLGSDSVAKLAQERNPETLRAALMQAGMSADQARQASTVLWRPELRNLLLSSDFIGALQQGKTIKLEARSQASVDARENPGGDGPKLTSTGKAEASGSLVDDKGQTIITGNADAATVNASFAKGELEVSVPQSEIRLEGTRADGSIFGGLQAQAENLKARLGPEVEVTTGKASVELATEATLDADKITEIQNLLIDFRDQLTTRLEQLGLSRDQFEQILKAFGREQLEAMFKSFKPDSIKGLSEDLGLSKEQIEQTIGLLNDQPFRRLVGEFFRFSELLNDSKAQVVLRASTQSGSWSKTDGDMLARLNQVTASAQIDTRNAQGSGTLTAEARQDSLSYRDSGGEQRVDWGKTTASASGTLRDSDNQRQLDGAATLNTDAGHLTQAGRVISSEFGQTTIQGSANQVSSDGSTGKVSGTMSVNGVTTERNLDQPASARMQVEELRIKAEGELSDTTDNQRVQGQFDSRMGQVTFRPESMDARDTALNAGIQAQRRYGADTDVTGSASLNVNADRIQSSEQDGVSIAQTEFTAAAETSASRQGTVSSRIEVKADQGRMTDLKAHDGEVSIESVDTQVSSQVQTPLVRGGLQGTLDIDGLQSKAKPGGTPEKQEFDVSARGFKLDAIEGTLKIKTDRLRSLIASSPDAKAILATVSERWAGRQGEKGNPNLFLNDEVTLKVDKGAWSGDATDGNALKGGSQMTGRFRFPDLNTRLATGHVDIELRNLSLSDEPGARAQVEVVGSAEFKPRQPEFNQSVQSLVEQNMKSIGVDLKPTVTYEGGQFKVKIDRWFVDGLISVDFEGDKIQVKIDKAKLLGFISARNLTARFSESQFNNYLLDIDRKGDTLSMSLNEFSEQMLHKDNLQIQHVETRPDGTIGVKFAYTDTAAYNAAATKRQQDKLETRLFRDPRSNQARTKDQIDSVVGELEPVRLKAVFQQGSPAQLRRILESAGNDYDNILRKLLKGESNYKSYPVANRAVIAAYLASDKGFLESVDREEQTHIRNFVNSLTPAERRSFDQALSVEERARIQKYLSPPPPPRPRPTQRGR